MTAAIDYKTKLVSQLINSCYKAQNGYRTAANAVKDETLSRLFEIYAQQRTRFAEELREYAPICEELDGRAEGGREMFGERDTLSGNELIRVCLEIDSRTLDLYKEALAQRSLPTRAHFLISAQLALLQRVHDRVSMMVQDRGVRSSFHTQRLSA